MLLTSVLVECKIDIIVLKHGPITKGSNLIFTTVLDKASIKRDKK